MAALSWAGVVTVARDVRFCEQGGDHLSEDHSRRSPYLIGLLGAAGVATTYGLIQLLVAAREVLLLMGLALFLAIGLDPPVRGLQRWMPRWAAVTLVTLGIVAVVLGFLAAAVPPLVAQGSQLVHELPHYLRELHNHSTLIGRLNDRFHLQQRAESLASGGGISAFSGLVGAGRAVLSTTAATLTALVLTVYFLADLPRIRGLIYRLFPASRRERVEVIGDQVFAKISRYVLGNILTSVIAGVGTFIWLVIFGVPYPLLLSLMVALLDLIPIIGSTVGGIIVSLVALTVSLPVALATGAYYAAFRLTEDYLIVPRVIGRVVQVSATLTFVAVLLGAATLGIVGALVAIPMAAGVRILLEETIFPWIDRS